MTEPNPVVAAIKIPQYNHGDPALWLQMCEATFELGTPKPVTESKTKYNYCVAHLLPETASLVRDILLSPATDDPYKTLKEALIDRSGKSGHQEIRPGYYKANTSGTGDQQNFFASLNAAPPPIRFRTS
ncbi:hypothetical protein JTE90_008715 [Oedothorax gibbosus]|uniref:DUF7041 domain-containing protein n=1 Tax=Oedothorax gibbosus TaxID=931172 RepID=A0AAV6TN46_9ARAC|nr:hypothetical protein JTE90_008715 [Oedothorax gibbosus]